MQKGSVLVSRHSREGGNLGFLTSPLRGG